MEIGVDSFGAVISDPATGLAISPVQRMDNLLDEIILAEQVGLDVFGIGEHHRSEFVDSAPVVILGAAAARTKNILLTSAVNGVLGGLSRITFQMGVSALPHERMSRSIELLGTRVAPIVRKQLMTVSSR